jgi:hypothetical protein
VAWFAFYLGIGRSSCEIEIEAPESQRFKPVARKLVIGIPADIASVQMIVNLQLPIQVQLLVGELQQPAKIAYAHSSPNSNMLPTASLARLFRTAHDEGQDCSSRRLDEAGVCSFDQIHEQS